MPTETLLPDALLAHAEWAGSPVIATIDEDPDTAGGDWLDPVTASGSGSSSPTARVSFPTPTGPPSGVQTFKARLGLVDALGTSPTARIDLYENGALKASGAAQTISSTKLLGGQVISQTFDLATTPLTTADGSAVEAMVIVTASGGSPSGRRSASLDSVNWDTVTYSTVASGSGSPLLGTLTGSGSGTVGGGGAPTSWTYDFETPVDSAITVANSEFESVSATAGQTLITDPTQFSSGAQAGKFAVGATTGQSYGAKTLFAGETTIYGGARVRIPSTLSNFHAFFRPYSGSTSRAQLGINSSAAPKIQLLNSASSTVVTLTSTVPVATWVRVEWMFDFATGAWEIRYYAGATDTVATETLSGTGASFGGTATEYRFGLPSTAANQTGLWLDRIGLSTSGFLGPGDSGGASGTGSPTLGSLSASGAGTVAGSAGATNLLYSSGGWLRNQADGSVFSGRGMNVHTTGFSFSQASFDAMATAGINWIRLMFWPKAIETAAGVYSTTETNHVKTSALRAKNAGIKVWLCPLINTPVWGTNGAEALARLPRHWINAGVTGPATPVGEWSTASHFDCLTSHGEGYLRYIVQQFRDDPNVVGFDLCNEPDRSSAGPIHRGINRMLAWLRAEDGDAKKLYLVATNMYSSQNAGTTDNQWDEITDWSRVVLQMHTYYAPQSVDANGGYNTGSIGLRNAGSGAYWNGSPEATTYATVNKASLRTHFESWKNLATSKGVPWIIGEVGVQHAKTTAAERLAWSQDIVDAAELEQCAGICGWIYADNYSQDVWASSDALVMRPEYDEFTTFTALGPTVWTDGFETGNTSQWDSAEATGAGTLVVSAGAARTGSFGLHVHNENLSGATANVRHNFPSANVVEASGWFRWTADSGTTSNNGTGLRFFAGATRVADVYRQDALAGNPGQLWLRTRKADSTFRYDNSGQTVALNVWLKYALRVEYNGSGAVSRVVVTINDVVRIDVSNFDLFSGAFTILQVGTEHQQIADVDVDDVVGPASAVSGASGTGSPLLGTVSATSAGKVAVAGQGSATLATPSSSGAGQVAVSGSSSSTLVTVTSSGTGTVGSTPIEGSGSLLLGSLSSAGAGKVEVRGAGAGTLPAITASGVAKAEVKGSGTNALAAFAASSSGKVEVSGSLARTLAAVTSSGAGAVAVRGSGSSLLGVVSASGVGKADIRATSAASLPVLASTGAGAVSITGAGSATLAVLTLSGAGTLGAAPISGSGAPLLATVTSTATGKVAVNGSGSGLLGTVAASGAAKADITGTGTGSLGALTATGAGKVEIRGTGGGLLGTVALTASGQGAVQGSGASTLATVASTGAGKVNVTGTLAAPLASLASTGTGAIGDVPISGAGTPLLAAPSAAGAGKVDVRGTGSASFATLTGSGTARVEARGTGAPSLGVLTATSTATVTVAGSGTPSLGTVSTVAAGSVSITADGTALLPAVSGSGTGTAATLVISGAGSPILFTALLGSGAGTVTGIGAVAPLRKLVLSTTTTGRELGVGGRTSGRRLGTETVPSRVLEVTNG